MNNKEIGQMLREHRKRKGYTLVQLARIISANGEYKLNQSNLTEYELGHHNINSRFLNAYIDAIGCDFKIVITDKN